MISFSTTTKRACVCNNNKRWWVEGKLMMDRVSTSTKKYFSYFCQKENERKQKSIAKLSISLENELKSTGFWHHFFIR